MVSERATSFRLAPAEALRLEVSQRIVIIILAIAAKQPIKIGTTQPVEQVLVAVGSADVLGPARACEARRVDLDGLALEQRLDAALVLPKVAEVVLVQDPLAPP